MRVNGMEQKPVVYFSSKEAAKKLGCCIKTVTRAARRSGRGVYVSGGKRLAALHPADLTALRATINETSGNPDWIAAAKAKPSKRS
jgi:hypothetical protein